MAVNKELLKGSTGTLILTLLSRKQMYGYELIKELEIVSGGLFELREGTLYPILHSLESDGHVKSEWVGEEGTRQRKYYSITKTGRGLLKEKRQEWTDFKTAIDKVVFG
ncbi:MAG: PadR family transcriptional regulator [Bdellovibrionales bacterium]|nr:PadR family transcriptional regulator [Bdellovibrionales bacterium]